jgi:predicted DNA-binding protein
MGIVTLRLNEEEEKILGFLQKYFNEDKSKILKEAMWDKFEDLRDRELIEYYEKKLNTGKIKFESADDLIKKIERKYKKII